MKESKNENNDNNSQLNKKRKRKEKSKSYSKNKNINIKKEKDSKNNELNSLNPKKISYFDSIITNSFSKNNTFNSFIVFNSIDNNSL
jgi:hypothetical protein